MSERRKTYTVVKLAPGSYDVLLDGNLVAALTRDIDGLNDEWQIDLLAESAPSEYPPPFDGQSRTFSSYQAALDWLSVYEEVAPRRSAPVRRLVPAAPRYRTHLGPTDCYRLKVLAERSRFYGSTIGLDRLIGRGFITATGRTDDEGRVEWMITDAGRSALAESEA